MCSLSIIRIIDALFTIYIHYDSVVWCNKDEKEYLKDNGIYIGSWSMVVCTSNYQERNSEVEIVQYFPSMFSKNVKINISPEYVKNNNSKGEAFWGSSMLYIIVLIVSIILIKYRLIPKLGE